MSVQTKINKRPMFDANGAGIGSEAALAMGIPGSRYDMHFMAGHAIVTTAATKYGYMLDDGMVAFPKEGVRYGGGIADSLDIAAGTAVTIVTKGHFLAKINVGTSKAAVAKGASLYKTAAGEITTVSTNNTAIAAKPILAAPYTAASGSGSSATPEKGAEQFTTDGTNWFVVLPIEL